MKQILDWKGWWKENSHAVVEVIYTKTSIIQCKISLQRCKIKSEQHITHTQQSVFNHLLKREEVTCFFLQTWEPSYVRFETVTLFLIVFTFSVKRHWSHVLAHWSLGVTLQALSSSVTDRILHSRKERFKDMSYSFVSHFTVVTLPLMSLGARGVNNAGNQCIISFMLINLSYPGAESKKLTVSSGELTTLFITSLKNGFIS